MCGLIGMAGAIPQSVEKAFKDLLIVCSLRGSHSSGVLFVTGGVTSVVKKAGNPFELFDSIKFEKECRYTNNVMMGHTRFATKGAVTTRNAHPFEFDTLVGAHNGTLTSQYKLDDYKDFNVDSENLYYHMERNGLEDTMKKCGGAYALSWYNKKDKSLNFIRNNERTLYTTFSADMKTLFWASESWMLSGVLGRNGIKHKEIVSLVPHVHYSLHIEPLPSNTAKVLSDFTEKDMPKYELPNFTGTKTTVKQKSKESNVYDIGKSLAKKYTKVCGKSVEFYTTGEHYNSSNNLYVAAKDLQEVGLNIRIYPKLNSKLHETLSEVGCVFSGTVKKVTVKDGGYAVIDIKTVKDSDIPFKSGSNVPVHLRDIPAYGYHAEDDKFLWGYNGSLLTKKEWKHETSKGCAWCGDTPDLLDHEELTWIDSHEHVCASCASLEAVKEYLKL